jgi:YD repeat-containing protein
LAVAQRPRMRPVGALPWAAAGGTVTGAPTGAYRPPTRVEAEGNHVLTYDPQRRPVRVHLATGAAEAPVWRAAYGGDGARRKRLDAAGTVHYAGPTTSATSGPGASCRSA